MTQAITVIRPGMLTTVQDLGRWGFQANGVPVAGPMDEYSHVLANRIVGNLPSAAALEVTLIGPELQAEAEVTCAVAGATFALTVGRSTVPMHAPFTLRPGDRLKFGARSAGARATLAVRGGLDVPALFGSRATSLISRMGPFGGRALQGGRCLPIAPVTTLAHRAPGDAPSFRCRFPPAARGSASSLDRRSNCSRRRRTTRFSDRDTSLRRRRIGWATGSRGRRWRMRGARTSCRMRRRSGSLQVPGSGQPILLMADRQTTGGYPKIGVVIGADLPLAGQLAPGDWIEFVPCTREAAVDALEAPASVAGWVVRGDRRHRR